MARSDSGLGVAMSNGEAQVAWRANDSSATPRRFRRLKKLWPLLCIVLGGTALIAFCFRSNRRTLSAEETALLGTWKWKNISERHNPARPGVNVTFRRDGVLAYSELSGLNSTWSVANGRLTITHNRQGMLSRQGPSLMLKLPDSFTWTITPTADQNQLNLKSNVKDTSAILTRSEVKL